jgi:holo-[acyl-carrier protein] synthase
MGIRVGNDLVSVADVRAAIARHGARYLRRVYTETEVADSSRHGEVAAERLAARFAAKEATIKVLRPSGGDAVPWRSIEVRRQPGGWVELELAGSAAHLATRAGVASLAVSLSHEADWATAVVIAEIRDRDRFRGI